MRYLLPLILMAASATEAFAIEIPYYRMDSLAYLSSDIVLCDEVQYVPKPGEYCYEATFTVIQTLKGIRRPKDHRLTVKIDSVYTRRLLSSRGPPPGKAPVIPMGRALLFLTTDKEGWRPVTGGVKLIIQGETYCYGQFADQPGPLWLARMAPENIEVPADKPYDEELLLKDLDAALTKAKGLTKAIPVDRISKHLSVIRKDYPPK